MIRAVLDFVSELLLLPPQRLTAKELGTLWS